VRPVAAALLVLLMTACASATPVTPRPTEVAAAAPGAPGPGTGQEQAPATTSAPSAPVAPVTVVLDPGHNGGNGAHPSQINRPIPTGRGGTKPCNTTGTATDGGYPEHAFAWAVTLEVREVLSRNGVNVVLTRENDDGVGPCANDRAGIANEAGAAALVSIHADGAAPASRGFHVIVSEPPLNPSQGPPSVALADAVIAALRSGGFPPSDYTGSNGLSPRPDLAGLNFAEVPAVIVECGNMRNPDESAAMSDSAGRRRYAEAIAAGVLAWLAQR
jgi:N-acetylmuramoyl-L-alanine amidase